MRPWQFSLLSLLISAAAASNWFVAIVDINSTGKVHPATAPMVLIGVTAAIHHLVRDKRDAWAISAFLAGVVVTASLYLAAGLNWWVS
jgi:hypothetical protein